MMFVQHHDVFVLSWFYNIMIHFCIMMFFNIMIKYHIMMNVHHDVTCCGQGRGSSRYGPLLEKPGVVPAENETVCNGTVTTVTVPTLYCTPIRLGARLREVQGGWRRAQVRGRSMPQPLAAGRGATPNPAAGGV